MAPTRAPRRNRLVHGSIAGLLLLATSACIGPVRYLKPISGFKDVDCAPRRNALPVDITYLGAGGFLFRRGDQAIMTAPFYSNPNLLQVGLGFPISSNEARVEALLPPVDDVTAILVGHAHYDHLMDVPYVARHRAPKAIVYGSTTMTHILAPVLPKSRLHSVNSGAGTWRRPGEWLPTPTSRIRFMALHSEHAPHFMGIKLFKGKIAEDLQHLPRTAYGWKEGQTFAYVIDFLGDDGKVDLRIHYQDAATNPPYGFHPQLDAKGVDVAILCVASFAEVKDYPEAIVRDMRPRHIVLAHWEDFFRAPNRPLAAVPPTNTKEFVIRLESALPESSDWTTPVPGTTLRFEVCDSGT